MMIDPKTSAPIRITGRADWCFGYSGRSGCEGSFVIAVEAKKPTTLFSAEPQLLTYLAMMRDQRKAMGKTNDTVQGFFTDGRHYVFMAIENDGTVKTSQSLLVLNPAGRKSIFNFIVHILETAMKSTLNATSTKPGEGRDKEIREYKTEVWEQVYARIMTPEILPADEDTLEFNDEFTL